MRRYLFSLVSLSLIAIVAVPTYVRAEKERLEPSLQSEISGLKMFIDLTPVVGHQKMMEIEPEATHHLSVNLEDERTGEKITEAEISTVSLSSDGKEVDNRTLRYMPKMAHFGGNIKLKEKGRYHIRIVVCLKGAKTRYSVTFPFVIP